MRLYLTICLALTPVSGSNLLVFILAGQSNMEGHAEVATINKTSGSYFNGTLAYQLSDPRTAALFAPLWNNVTHNWTVLPDIKVWFNENGTEFGVNGSVIPSEPGNASFGDLTTGFGTGWTPNLIGPELGFGFGLHDAFGGIQPVLLMKTAWGGKSLAGDYRPPSSVAQFDVFCQGNCSNVVGHYYQTMVADVHKMLAPGAIGAMFPDLAGLTPVLSGFGWFHGWNDGCDLNQTAAYEWNMANLIHDLREEWGVPALPVSIGVAGFNGFDGEEATRLPKATVPWIDQTPAEKISSNCANDRGCRRLDIALGQLAVGNATRHPEFNGHVVTVETRGFWRDPQYSPNQSEGYHYWHNAETCYLVGRAMAQGMVQAMQARLSRE